MTDARETLWRIRPLMWEENHGWHFASTPFGDISVRQSATGSLYIAELRGERIARCDLQSAKAAAEKWYFDRLTQALEPVTRGE